MVISHSYVGLSEANDIWICPKMDGLPRIYGTLVDGLALREADGS